MAQQNTHLKKLQAKIFRGQNDPVDSKDDGKAARPNTDSPSLTINIPNPVLNDSSQPAPAPPKNPKADAAPRPEQQARTFRQRLVDSLGADYTGAERFRLDQDDKKECHWKRWGPYLSDRQWVRGRESPFTACPAA